MSNLHGHNLLAHRRSSQGTDTFCAVDPSTQTPLEPAFVEATSSDIDDAMTLAESAFWHYRKLEDSARAAFLRAIADGLAARVDDIAARAQLETALPAARLHGEMGRTTNQLRMFADLISAPAYRDIRVDRALPERQPPRPDLRRMLIPTGPVVVFGASNFPLAFSVAGGDTASALAAGCPVVVKAHPAHPGTSELVAEVILEAAQKTAMPEGVFSMVHGRSHEVGLALVRHPNTTAVGFTGSLRAGRALFDAANSRPTPIPVYAEMGSTNPVFVLPGALAERSDAIAAGLAQSVILGVGQFCTNPGVVIAQKGDALDAFVSKAAEHFQASQAGIMLYSGVHGAYQEALARARATAGVQVAGETADASELQATAAIMRTDAQTFAANDYLSEEIFGPATLVVESDVTQMLAFAKSLSGHLTATIHGSEAELPAYQELIEVLETKVGRLIFNGFPTGVEVCAAMNHGGPYPATTDVRTTSVGSAAIERFLRPICYQGFPQTALPAHLRD
jgi:NADP-dependent aldehyde dehydrogenase